MHAAARMRNKAATRFIRSLQVLARSSLPAVVAIGATRLAEATLFSPARSFATAGWFALIARSSAAS
jgi:hypothetical protein